MSMVARGFEVVKWGRNVRNVWNEGYIDTGL